MALSTRIFKKGVIKKLQVYQDKEHCDAYLFAALRHRQCSTKLCSLELEKCNKTTPTIDITSYEEQLMSRRITHS